MESSERDTAKEKLLVVIIFLIFCLLEDLLIVTRQTPNMAQWNKKYGTTEPKCMQKGSVQMAPLM